MTDMPDVKVYAGSRALDEIVEAEPINMVLTAMVGFAGLSPTIHAIKAGKALFSTNEDGDVVLEYDINSLVTNTDGKPEDIYKNRPLRVYDSFCNDCLINFVPGKFENDIIGWSVMEGIGNSMLQAYEEAGAITNVDLEADFLELAKARGLVGVKGHRSVGGFRASCYNALPMESVDALIETIHDWDAAH